MKYNVGDKVLIRQWDDMAAEFGTNADGGIKTMFGFGRTMKSFCGVVVTISRVFNSYYHIAEDPDPHIWTDGMIERKVEAKMKMKFKVGDIVRSVDDSSGEGKIVRVDENDHDLPYQITCIDRHESLKWVHECDIELVEPGYIFKLETGQVVEVRNKNKYLVLDKPGEMVLMNLNGWGFLFGSDYDDKLKSNDGRCEYDIVTIYEGEMTLDGCRATKTILWQRIEPKKMTMAGIESVLGYPIEIVATLEEGECNPC